MKTSTNLKGNNFSVGVIRCDALVERQAKGNLYYWDTLSPHLPAVEQVFQFLRSKRINTHIISDDRLDNPKRLLDSGIRVLIIPRARRFAEQHFEELKAFAEFGGVVIATYPSFQWDMPIREKSGWADKYASGDENDQPPYPSEHQGRRLQSIFSFESMVLRRIWGRVHFRENEYSWVWAGVAPHGFEYDTWAWIVSHPGGTRIGDLEIDKAGKGMEGSQPSEFPPLSPLILIQEYPETGGAFFYTCFHIMDHFDKANLKQIFLNIIQKQRQHEVRPALVNLESIEQVVILKRQLQIMKVLLILAMLGVGLLVSRLWFPGTDFDSLLKTIVTMAVTGLVGLLMTQFQKWFSGPDSSS